MSKAEEIQRMALVLDRIKQLRQMLWGIRQGGPMRPLLGLFRSMEIQSKVQQELDRLVVQAAIEDWVHEEATNTERVSVD